MRIPDGWYEIKIQNICELGRGRVISAEEIEQHPGVYPVYSSQSFNKGEMGAIDSYDFDGEFVTWTTDGAYAGTVFYRTGKFNCTNVCGTLRARDAIDMQFLAYKLGTVAKQYVSYVGNPKLMNGVVADIRLIIPQRTNEQSKIAEILSTVDRAIEQTEALIDKQQRIKTGLMHDLLTRGIDEYGNLRSEETHEFKDSPLGRIPVEWEVKKIDEIVVHVCSGLTPRGGESVYRKEGVLFIRSQNVHFDGLRLDDVAFIPMSIHRSMLRSEVYENDVLLNITGASIGRCCCMPRIEGKANVNQHVCVIRLRNAIKSQAEFLASVLMSHIGQRQIVRFNAGGNREGLNYQQVRRLLIPQPSSLDEFNRIYQMYKIISDDILVHKTIHRKLLQLKTALMQDLLTGKVRVTPLLNNKE